MAKFVISKSIAISQFEKLRSVSTVSYSSKTNQVITPLLEEHTDSLFSVHFEAELAHIKDASRVIFLAQAWSSEQIQRLYAQGIRRFIIDNEADLQTLLDYLKESDAKIELFLRMKLKEYSVRTERYFVFGMGSEKINKHIASLKDHPQIEKLGVHFHRKTQNMSEWNLKEELEQALEDSIEHIDMINIGGGFPIEYANTNIDVFNTIVRKITELKEWLDAKKIELILEPGRFIAGPAGKLVTKIIGVDDNTIVVDASVYQSDMDAILVPVKLKIEGELKKGSAYAVKGITPCSMDLFRYRVYLNNPKKGDELIFINAGAYNFCSDFCDLEPLEVEIVE